MLTWGDVTPSGDAEYNGKSAKPKSETKSLELAKLATPQALYRLSQFIYWFDPIMLSKWSYEDVTITLEGASALEVLDRLAELRPERDCTVDKPCGAFFKFDTSNVRGHAYCEILRLGNIWGTPYIVSLYL